MNIFQTHADIVGDYSSYIQQCLLALNHQRAAEEQAKVPMKADKAGKGKAANGKR